MPGGRVRGRGIARRLAERVGSSGRVVATDLDIRFVEDHGLGNLEARRHDILTDPLEEGAFDLAHARAVIMHVPDHQGTLERMVAAVRPGGWVVIEDVDFGGPMAAALAHYSFPAGHAPLVERIYRAAEAVLSAAGADASHGTRLLAGLQAAGLEHVGGELHTPVVAGGTESWVRGSIQQLAARMEARDWWALTRWRASSPWSRTGRAATRRRSWSPPGASAHPCDHAACRYAGSGTSSWGRSPVPAWSTRPERRSSTA
jgi:SAM-dependent methyltransferase